MANKKIIFSGGSIDLYNNGNDFSLTYGVNDVSAFGFKYSTYSGSIFAPNSSGNSRTFSYAFEISTDLTNNITFNPNKKLNVQIIEEGIGISDGYLQLVRINKLDTINNVDYELQFYGNNLTLINNVEGKYLHDLDFSEYDHCFSGEKIKQSWTAGTDNGYVYSLIDYGQLSPGGDSQFGFQDYGLTGYIYAGDYRPGIYAYPVLKKIFKLAGKTWQSDFLENDYFKRQFIPFGNERFLHNQAWCDSQHFRADLAFLNTIQLTPGQSTKRGMIPFDSYQNPNSFYNYSDCAHQFPNFTWFEYKVRSKGKYKFSASAHIEGQGFFPNIISLLTGRITIEVVSGVNASQYDIKATGEYANGSQTGNGWDFWNHIVTCSTDVIELNYGDKVSCWVSMETSTPNYQYFMTVHTGSTTWFKTELIEDCEVSYGQSFAMNDNLPLNYPIDKFVLDILKKFNCRMQPSLVYADCYEIEPYSQFYTGVTQDWTKKLANDKPQVISLLASTQPKQLNLSFKQDEDFLNTDYEDKTKRIYGNKVIENENEFSDEIKNVELMFSPTPSVEYTFIPLYHQYKQTLIVPAIYPNDYKHDNSTFTSYVNSKSNIRLLNYNGLKPCNSFTGTTPNFLTGYAFITGYIAYSIDGPNPTPEYDIEWMNEYPHSGMMNGLPDEATHDLAFDLCDKYYFSNTSGITQNNLYTDFFEDNIRETLSPNSKLLTAYFALTVLDIQKLSFRNPILVGDSYYKLNKIIDYKGADTLTKVELILTEQTNVPVKPRKQISRYPLTISNVNNLTVGRNVLGQGTNFNITTGAFNYLATNSSGNITAGKANIIQSNGSLVTGFHNSGYSSYSAIIGGSGNTNGYLFIGSGETNIGSIVTGSTSGSTIQQSPFTGWSYTQSYDHNFMGGGVDNKLLANRSAIIAGSGNTILDGLFNTVIAGGSGLTATTSNTLFTSRIDAKQIYSAGTELSTLFGTGTGGGLTSGDIIGTGTGNILSGTSGSVLVFRTLSGGTGIKVTTEQSTVTVTYTGSSGTAGIIRNGINTFTAGTSGDYTVNVTALTISNITVSGNSSFNTLSANTISGSTFISGSTNLSSLFATSTQLTNSNNNIALLQLQINTKVNRSGDTLTGLLTGTEFSGQSISATTFYSGSTPLSQLISGNTYSSQNVGSGTNIYSATTGNTFLFKTISADTRRNIFFNLTADTSNITISSSFDVSKYRMTGGSWHNGTVTMGATNPTVTVTTNKLSATPLIISKETTIDGLCFSVTTTGSTGAVGVGLYNDNGNIYPDRLIFGGTSGYTATTIGTAGVRYLTGITPSITLSPALYWLVAYGQTSTGSASLSSHNSTTGLPSVFNGGTGAGSVPLVNSTVVCHTHTLSWTGGTCPNTFPTTSPGQATSAIMVWARIV
jgi:hypothetical protein